MSYVTVGESYLSEFLPSSLVWEATFDGGNLRSLFFKPCRGGAKQG